MADNSIKMAPQQSLEWLNENMHRNYPLDDAMVPLSTDGRYLPSSFLADLRLSVPAAIQGQTTGANFYLKEIRQVSTTIQFTLGYRVSNNSSFTAAVVSGIPLSLRAGSSQSSRTFQIYASDQIPDTFEQLRQLTGTVVIGTCADMLDISYMLFTYGSSRISPLCVTVNYPGLQSVIVQDSDGQTITRLTDDFILKAGDGIQFQVDWSSQIPVLTAWRVPTQEEQQQQASINQIVTQVLNALGTPIQRINGIEPDSNGNIRLVGLDCTEIKTGQYSLTISNTCSKPCCDQQNADDLSAAIQSMEDVKTRLLNYMESLSTNINIMQTRLASLIASRS